MNRGKRHRRNPDATNLIEINQQPILRDNFGRQHSFRAKTKAIANKSNTSTAVKIKLRCLMAKEIKFYDVTRTPCGSQVSLSLFG
jgi:hypothetical protein